MSKPALIVSAFINVNAQKNPVTLRFQAENDLPNFLRGTSRMVVDSSVVAASEPKPLTRLFPVSREVFDSWGTGVVAEELPTNGKDPFVFEEPIDPVAVYGYPVGIQVIEKTVPEYQGQEPKKNPTTGAIMKHKGMPIYRHHIVQPLEDCGEHVLLESDKIQLPAA